MNKPYCWVIPKMQQGAFYKEKPSKMHTIPLYTHPVKEPDFTVEKDSQNWKGMDGATAFWLIERHSNHWDDARLMMEEWLKANSHPVKELTQGEIHAVWASGSYYTLDKEGNVDELRFEDFAKAILRKASEK